MVAKPMAEASTTLDVWLDEDAKNASAQDLGLTVIDHSFRAMLHSLAQGLAVVVVFMSALVVLLVAAFYLRYCADACVSWIQSVIDANHGPAIALQQSFGFKTKPKKTILVCWYCVFREHHVQRW